MPPELPTRRFLDSVAVRCSVFATLFFGTAVGVMRLDHATPSNPFPQLTTTVFVPLFVIAGTFSLALAAWKFKTQSRMRRPEIVFLIGVIVTVLGVLTSIYLGHSLNADAQEALKTRTSVSRLLRQADFCVRSFPSQKIDECAKRRARQNNSEAPAINSLVTNATVSREETTTTVRLIRRYKGVVYVFKGIHDSRPRGEDNRVFESMHCSPEGKPLCPRRMVY